VKRRGCCYGNEQGNGALGEGEAVGKADLRAGDERSGCRGKGDIRKGEAALQTTEGKNPPPW